LNRTSGTDEPTGFQNEPGDDTAVILHGQDKALPPRRRGSPSIPAPHRASVAQTQPPDERPWLRRRGPFWNSSPGTPQAPRLTLKSPAGKFRVSKRLRSFALAPVVVERSEPNERGDMFARRVAEFRRKGVERAYV